MEKDMISNNYAFISKKRRTQVQFFAFRVDKALRKKFVCFSLLFLCLPIFSFTQSAQTTSSGLSVQQEQEIENALGISPLSMEVFDIDK
jgi:hypothetical protein